MRGVDEIHDAVENIATDNTAMTSSTVTQASAFPSDAVPIDYLSGGSGTDSVGGASPERHFGGLTLIASWELSLFFVHSRGAFEL
jgi:hypothetical protein